MTPFGRMNAVIESAVVSAVFCDVGWAAQGAVERCIEDSALPFRSAGDRNSAQHLIPHCAGPLFDVVERPARNLAMKVRTRLPSADVRAAHPYFKLAFDLSNQTDMIAGLLGNPGELTALPGAVGSQGPGEFGMEVEGRTLMHLTSRHFRRPQDFELRVAGHAQDQTGRRTGWGREPVVCRLGCGGELHPYRGIVQPDLVVVRGRHFEIMVIAGCISGGIGSDRPRGGHQQRGTGRETENPVREVPVFNPRRRYGGEASHTVGVLHVGYRCRQ